jgi:CheY-like chemotaxis protein
MRSIVVTTKPLTGLRVLLVEDDADTLDVIALVLGHAGATVVRASSVREAMEAMALATISVVVSDVDMPHEDGLALARRLRSHRSTAHIPLVALTAHVSDAMRRETRASGFDCFAVKPVDPHALVACVADAFAQRKPPERA